METLDRITTELDTLRNDGDTVQLPNGDTLRLYITPDDGFTINEYDCYGRIEWSRVFDDGTHTRPDTMNGDARIIDRERGSVLWWQPPCDLAREHYAKYQNDVTDICRYGFQVYTLELLSGSDVYGRGIVTRYATMGGIEPFISDDYAGSVLRDLLSDLQAGE